MSGNIPIELSTEFHIRCMAMVNRRIGEIAIEPDVTVEAGIGNPETDLFYACFDRNRTIVSPDGRRAILHTYLSLDAGYTFSTYSESEYPDGHTRPTTASEDVIRGYMHEDLRNMFTAPGELGANILMQYFREMEAAENLGLYDVDALDVIEAINTMNEVIRAHDQA